MMSEFKVSPRLLIVVAMAINACQAVAEDPAADPPQPAPVWGLAFSPDGALLAAAAGDRAGDGVVSVWKTADWSALFTLEEPRAPTCVAFSPDGTTLLVGTQAAEVFLIDVPEGSIGRRWDTDQKVVNGVTWTPDGEHVLTAGSDGTIKVWDAASGERQQTLDTWAADGLPNPRTQPQDPDRPSQQRLIWDLAVSVDGHTLLSGGWEDTTRLWDLRTGELIQSFTGMDVLVQGVAFTPDGRHFAISVRANAEVIVRETNNGFESAVLRAGARDIAIHPDGELLAASSGAYVFVFQLNLTLPTDADVERYQQLLAQLEHDDVTVREATSTEILRIGLPIAPLLYEALQAPGAETRMRSRRLWNQVRSPGPLATLSGHEGELRQVVFSPDGSLLATACKRGEVRIWDVPGFKLQRVLTVNGMAVR